MTRRISAAAIKPSAIGQNDAGSTAERARRQEIISNHILSDSSKLAGHQSQARLHVPACLLQQSHTGHPTCMALIQKHRRGIAMCSDCVRYLRGRNSVRPENSGCEASFRHMGSSTMGKIDVQLHILIVIGSRYRCFLGFRNCQFDLIEGWMWQTRI